MKNIWRLIKLIPGYRWRIASVVLVSTALGLINIAIPYLFKSIIDQIAKIATAHGQTIALARIAKQVWIYLVILATIRLMMIALQYAQDRISDSVWITSMTSLRAVLFEHVLGLSIDYFEVTKTGEIMQRVNNSVTDLLRWLYSLSNGTLVNVLSVVFYITLVAVKSPWAGVILLVVVALNILNSAHRVSITKPIRRLTHADVEQAFGTINETVANISTVRSLAAEDSMRQRYYHWIERFEVNRIRQMRVEWNADAVNGFLNAAAVLSAVGLMIQGSLQGRYTPGDLYLVLSLTTSAIGNLSPLTRLINDTGDIETSAERVTDLLDIKPTVADRPGAKGLEAIGTIEFRHVSFSYPGKRRRILHDVSFKIKPGQSLALVGPSGTGKTTIIKLLMRFYDPTEGQVLIDGVDLREYSQQSLRQKLGVVMQDVALLNDTVEENLRFASPNATKNAVRGAAQIAHADVFIDKLPQKYKTLVGERGVKLSGGEKQRVAIARAILRDPQLIILDEATSALDSASERYVQDGLKALMQGRTAVIIAHRLSTVMEADQIVVLKEGHVIERGTHAQLTTKKRGNLYAKLYAMQTAGALK